MLWRPPFDTTGLLSGDFNYLVEGETKTEIHIPTAQHDPPLNPAPQHYNFMANAPTWKPVLNSLIEICQGMYTHITESSLVGARIDRVYVFGASWTTSLLNGNCHIWKEARVLHLSGISDHAHVSATLAAFAQSNKKSIYTSVHIQTSCIQTKAR